MGSCCPVYQGVLISGGPDRGVPAVLFIEVSSFQGILIESKARHIDTVPLFIEVS